MKPYMFALGLILLSLGVFFLAGSSLSREEETTEIVAEAGRHGDRAWEIEAQLRKGDNVTVRMDPDAYWVLPGLPGKEYEYSGDYPGEKLKIAALDIINPRDERTTFGILYVVFEEQLMMAPANISAYISPYSSDGHALDLSQTRNLHRIGGIVKYSGLHKVVVRKPPIYPVPEMIVNGTLELRPPAYLAIMVTSTEKGYPWHYLRWLGVLGTVSGTALIIWSVKRPRRRIRSARFKVHRKPT